MLRKIDCVMVHVDDLTAGIGFYTRTLGLREMWRDGTSAGLGMPETDAEIVLHTFPLPAGRGVGYLVDDVRAAVAGWGSEVLERPFEIAIGWCAVLGDPFGNPVCILDMTKGARG
ncbi:VOC family protein [Actinoplanes sp. CA-030573]|uniref:VOC family protein n=1 Tax=Actinoplanes sp. CA-030573 TaxID=3239898 RepID=UPI003D91C5CA